MVRLHPKFVYCNLHSNLYLHLKKLFPYSTWAVWLHLGHSRTSWPLTWAYKKIPLVTDYWNLLSLSSIVEGFFLFFSCYASLFAFLELAFSILVSLLLQYFFVIWEIETLLWWRLLVVLVAGEACWWTIHPASKQRSEGEKVRVGDDLILVSVSSERYLVRLSLLKTLCCYTMDDLDM